MRTFLILSTMSLLVVVCDLNAESKLNAEILRIGVVAPFSGAVARYGEFIRQGVELARDDLEDRNRLEIIYEDDSCSGVVGVSATQKLIRVDKVSAIIGSWCSSVVLAQAPIVNSLKTVLMAIAVSPQIRDAGPFVFRIQPDSREYLRVLVPYLLKNRGLTRWSILHIENDFGRDMAKYFSELVESSGGKLLSNQEYLPDTTDYRSQLIKIRSLDADGIFLPGYAEVGVIMKQARQLGIESVFAGTATIENPDILQTAGRAAEGTIFPQHFDLDSNEESFKKFRNKFIKRYNVEPEGFSMLAFDALTILSKAAENCANNSECIKGKLEHLEFQSTTGLLKFDEFGDSIRPIILKQITNGGFVSALGKN